MQGKAVIARFDGGRLSSEVGLPALREIERRLGVADRLAACRRCAGEDRASVGGDHPVSHANSSAPDQASFAMLLHRLPRLVT
jgi:hypothetical protein